jgi:hypothetical protein
VILAENVTNVKELVAMVKKKVGGRERAVRENARRQREFMERLRMKAAATDEKIQELVQEKIQELTDEQVKARLHELKRLMQEMHTRADRILSLRAAVGPDMAARVVPLVEKVRAECAEIEARADAYLAELEGSGAIPRSRLHAERR